MEFEQASAAINAATTPDEARAARRAYTGTEHGDVLDELLNSRLLRLVPLADARRRLEDWLDRGANDSVVEWLGRTDPKILNVVTPLAEAGDPDAQYMLSACYFTGYAVEQDGEQATLWLGRAVDSGHELARSKLREQLNGWLDRGINESVDEWLRRVKPNMKFVVMPLAKAGDPDAQYIWATALFSKARTLIEKGEAGLLPGPLIGYTTSIVDRYKTDAVAKLREAADQGHTGAQVILGRCLLFGRVVNCNLEGAFQLFRVAAETGNPEAQFMLGRCYHQGLGVPQDIGVAMEWYQQSADQGFEKAKDMLEQ